LPIFFPEILLFPDATPVFFTHFYTLFPLKFLLHSRWGLLPRHKLCLRVCSGVLHYPRSVYKRKYEKINETHIDHGSNDKMFDDKAQQAVTNAEEQRVVNKRDQKTMFLFPDNPVGIFLRVIPRWAGN
jgi:hypothetical protein